jgi:uncharacterized protein YjbI with pentapeptide repeats
MSEPVSQQPPSLQALALRLQNTKSENDTQLSYPTTNTPDAWTKYWKEQGQPWRTEKVITDKRQKQLDKRRTTVKPNVEKGKYPFKGMKLRRADIEWLLATHTHQGIYGPVDWSDENQREHEGLDLRGADLRGIDLQGLPLARLLGGLNSDEWFWYGHAEAEKERQPLLEAGIHLEGANLSRAHVEGASLIGAYLTGTTFMKADLENTGFMSANAAKADFRASHLEHSDFCYAFLEEAYFGWAHLQKAVFMEAYLNRADFSVAHIEEADFCGATMELVNFTGAYLQQAILGAQPADEIFEGPHLEGACFYEAHLEGATLEAACLGGKKVDDDDVEKVKSWFMRYPERLRPENMSVIEPADFRRAFFDAGTKLDNAQLGDEKYGYIALADVHWGDVNVSTLDWSKIHIVGDEYETRQKRSHGHIKERATRRTEYEGAVRAYRQVTVVLQSQGLDEDAARFAYRAHLMQRKVFWHQRAIRQYIGSLLLYFLAGYGYKWWRSFVAYLMVIGLFAVLYHQLSVHLAWNEAVVISMTAFHGRGFFPDQFHPGDPQALVASIEAFVGLLIEVTFIATLTQRLFGK